ncbi:extracellular solute-binding protein [Oceaniglobus trochenteri]|uniref:extracellular solute-binding protein n=1 Tax=Oceaniglobus trochenteri TaxID=2763260 RepID=UPI001CFF8F5D|nr:extracellular solute-binding protein [Oceaniglobus trochenteri]
MPIPHTAVPRSRAAALSAPVQDQVQRWSRGLAVLVLGTGLALCAGMARSEGDEKIITSHAFSDLGTPKYGPDFKHLDYVNPDAPKGGEMSVWARGTFDSMNAAARQGRASAFSLLPHERIMESTADDAYAVYCLLCETLEYPESQDWVIFNLRPEATFSDGTPLTAEDIKYTFDLFMEQGFPSFRIGVGELIPKVEVLGPHRIKFHFNPDKPKQGRISQAGASIAYQKKWFEETGARLDESRLEASPGTGPYVVETVDPPRKIVVRRNPDYWGKDLPINQGRWNYDTMRVEYFADSNAALEGFKAGVYTFRQETSSITWATQYDFPALENGTIIKTELKDGSLPAATGIVFNMKKEKFQDIRVRRALGLMFNFTWTNDTLQYGLFKQRASFWENSDLAATGVPEGRELELLESVADMIDPSILTEPVTMPHESGDRQLDRGNLREANRLMDEAGWVIGDDGKRRKDGKVFEVEFLQNNPSFDRILTPYVDNLKRLGINATYNRIDDAQYTSRERDGDFDMIYDYYQSGLVEGSGLGQRLGCEDADDVFNPANYCNPAVDKLIDVVIGADTLDEMKAAVRAVDRLLRFDHFMIPVWYNDSFWVAYYDMFEHPENMPPYALGHMDFWWYNAEKAEKLRAAGAL